MRVYCDTNVYCRPFNDQSQPRIRAETEAFLRILERVDQSEITLVSSDILVAEVSRISDQSRRRLVELYLGRCTHHISATLEIVQAANRFVKECELKAKDAFHVSSACYGQVPYLLTCDDRFVRKKQKVAEITQQLGLKVELMNPVTFVDDVLEASDQAEEENNGAD